MEDLHVIIKSHALRYPEMQPTDAVKLLYQNEFGGGHLIRDEDSCLARLKAEYRDVVQSGTEPLTEEIGNGMIRVNLRSLDAHSYHIDRLGADFICSASIQQGSMESFLNKLQVLQQLADEGCLPFCRDALDAYLSDYKRAGYPPVSHSPQYRAAYAPAYRIIRKDCLPF